MMEVRLRRDEVDRCKLVRLSKFAVKWLIAYKFVIEKIIACIYAWRQSIAEK